MSKKKKYTAFENLPHNITRKLKKLMLKARENSFSTPKFTEEELFEITKLFCKVNNVIIHGIPNQLYDMFSRQMDSAIAVESSKKHFIWYGHKGEIELNRAIKDFMDYIWKRYG